MGVALSVPGEGRTRSRTRGLSIAQLSWRLGVSVREYRELVEGEAWPSYDVWERIEEFSGGGRRSVQSG
jgi:hypothetical protein